VNFFSGIQEGLTADETTKKEPDDADRMQMTSVRCSRCSQLTVGLRDIIQAGHGDRYQVCMLFLNTQSSLECIQFAKTDIRKRW
jgi:hypothetical protein